MQHLSALTNEQLEQGLIAEAGNERHIMARVIEKLAEVCRRDWHLERGYARLSDYCVDVLGFSPDQALRRAAAARLSLRYPIIPQLLRNGDISFTTLQVLSPVLKAPGDEGRLLAACGKTRFQVECMVADEDPKAAVRSSVRPLGKEHFELRVTITAEAEAALMRLRDIDRHAIPSGDLGELVSKAVIERCAKVEARKFAKLKREKKPAQDAPVHSEEKIAERRKPDREMTRTVAERDAYRCCYTSADGHRCASPAWLENDHVMRWADGGETKVANMQLLCRAHNQWKERRGIAWAGRLDSPAEDLRESR